MNAANTISVLVVDDSAILRSVLVEYLSSQQNMVVLGDYEDGVQAVAQVIKMRPDVLLLDISMPNLDGIGVLKILSALTLPTKTIVFTGYSDTDIKEQCYQQGAYRCLEKGTPLSVISIAIQEAVANV